MTQRRLSFCPDCRAESGPLLVVTHAEPRTKLCSDCRVSDARIRGAMLALSRVAVWVGMEARAQQEASQGADVYGSDEGIPNLGRILRIRWCVLGSTLTTGRLRLTYADQEGER